MKIILNQYFPLNNTDITERNLRPNDVQKTDAEYLLFLRSDDETRDETSVFLKRHFENGVLETNLWRHHIRDLRDRGRNSPSFALLHLTNPVQILLYGFCQVLYCHQGQILEVLKPETPQTLSSFDRIAKMDAYWLLGYSDAHLAEPLAKTAIDAMQQQEYPFEEFFYNRIYEAGILKKFNVTIVEAQEMVDLDLLPASPYIAKRLAQMAKQALPTTKTWIEKVLEDKREPKKDRWGRVLKPDYEALYNALQPDLKLKQREINALQQLSHYSKVLELETALEQKTLSINHLQTEILSFKQQIAVFELAQKGSAMVQKELDDLKIQYQQVVIEKAKIVKDLSSLKLQLKNNIELAEEFKDVQTKLLQFQAEKKDLWKVERAELEHFKDIIIETLLDHKIELTKIRATIKDTLILYECVLAANVNAAHVHKVIANIPKSLSSLAFGTQIMWSSELKSTIFIEIPNSKQQLLMLQNAYNQLVKEKDFLSNQHKHDLQNVHNQSIEPQPKWIAIPTPIVPIPIIITQPSIKSKLPFEPEMILVEGGTFKMGGQVTLSSFMIGKYPITQAQWKVVMGNNPSNFKGDNLPVEKVSWDDAQQFLTALNSKTGKMYSLPTEAQWEFAARGGNKSKGYKYSGSDNLDEVGWFRDNSESKTHPVGKKDGNELEIHDMSGSVWEWCADSHGAYSSAAVTNPTGADEGTRRVLRGGSWNNGSQGCRVAFRNSDSPSARHQDYGFRVVSFP